MSIIDKTYFEAHNLVVNVNEPEPNSATDRDLDVLIASVEEYVLSNALGRKFYNEIKQYYKELPSEPIPAEVNNLVDGCEYTYNGEERYWRGLRQENTKESLLADLVYYCYHTNNVTLTTSFGEQAVEGKLGNRASIFRKVI